LVQVHVRIFNGTNKEKKKKGQLESLNVIRLVGACYDIEYQDEGREGGKEKKGRRERGGHGKEKAPPSPRQNNPIMKKRKEKRGPAA